MQHILDLLSKCTGFEWDAGNIDKNWISHQVHWFEAEQAIINRPIALTDDYKHSDIESRYIALGSTNVNRLLSVVFTIRRDKVRVISARDMDIEEKRQYYEEAA